jgi:hypothetical protein
MSTASDSRSRLLPYGTSAKPSRTPDSSSASSAASTRATAALPTTSQILLSYHPSLGPARCSPSKSCILPMTRRPRQPSPWWPPLAPPALPRDAAPSYDAPTSAPPKGSGGGGNKKGKGSKKQGGWRGQGNANNGWQQCPNRGQPPHGTMVLLQPMGFPGRCSFRWRLAARPQVWQLVAGQPRWAQPGPHGCQPTGHFAAPPPPSPVWDQAGLIAALNQMALQNSGWVMDSSATSHMHNTDGILLSRQPSFVPSITVGDGHHLPVSCSSTSTLPGSTSSFSLRNVLVVPSLVRNLLLVRQFTRDNNCTIEFDAFGFSVKDLQTRRVILRSNSSDDLYTVPATPQANLATSTNLWHHRLGHIQELLP